jgi:serine/threonine-protein kinase
MAEPSDRHAAGPKELTGQIGKYEILRTLGRGAMGHVYVAHDTVLDRDVALKVMVAQIADDPELKQRFEREARAIAKMTHPNVVTVFDLGSHSDGSPYIAMELLRGRDLQKAMRQAPPLPLERKVAIIVQVLAGLAQAHEAGIVHRDIKPANIFIREDGSVKIMDFGVARLTTASMTGTGNIVGTADYMSPEQVQGAKVDGRSDLFSVGCLLFELLAGRRPFHAESLMAIFYKITHEELDFSLIPEGPEYDGLLPPLRKALAKQAGERYQTAREFAKDLRDWLRTHAPETAAQGVLAEVAASATIVDGPQSITPSGVTTDLGRPRTGPTSRRTAAGTRAAGATVLEPAPSRPAARRAPVPAPPVRSSGRGLLPWLALGLLLATLAGALVFVWRSRQPVAPPATSHEPAPPATSLALAPAVTEPPVTVAPPAPPPLTAAPQPTFAQAEGRAASSIREARAAFDAGSYARAIAAAQQALRDDAGSAVAKQVLEKALAGQKALVRVASARAALARGDLAAAENETTLALAEAPWDRAAVELRSRIEAAKEQAQRDGEAKAQQARTARVNALLGQAASAMEAKQFDAAVAAYNQVLELEPGNIAAHTGKSNAITAKTVAEAAAGGGRAPAAPVHGFVAGRTDAKGRESSAGLVGFEESGVAVKRATQAAELPGKIHFETVPAAPQPGERFSVSAYLRNEGSQPIQLASMLVATTIDGKTQKGRVPLVATTVAPRDRALVFQARDQLLREGTRAWTIEVSLFTSAGETYRNTLSWK